jgi:hypothetical protein
MWLLWSFLLLLFRRSSSRDGCLCSFNGSHAIRIIRRCVCVCVSVYVCIIQSTSVLFQWLTRRPDYEEVCAHVYVWVCMYVYIHIYTSVLFQWLTGHSGYEEVCWHVCVHVCVCVLLVSLGVYAHTHTHIHTYTHTCIQRELATPVCVLIQVLLTALNSVPYWKTVGKHANDPQVLCEPE